MKYNTKQKDILFKLIENQADNHFTIEQLVEKLRFNNIEVGQTTVYRFVDELLKQGKVRKFITNNNEKACYQYINNLHECKNHYHMVCEKCGKLIHLDCHEIDDFIKHISLEHHFNMDMSKVVFYGLCENCQKGSINQ